MQDSGWDGGLDALGERDCHEERNEDGSARDRLLEPIDIERQGVLDLRERKHHLMSTLQRQ